MRTCSLGVSNVGLCFKGAPTIKTLGLGMGATGPSASQLHRRPLSHSRRQPTTQPVDKCLCSEVLGPTSRASFLLFSITHGLGKVLIGVNCIRQSLRAVFWKARW